MIIFFKLVQKDIKHLFYSNLIIFLLIGLITNAYLFFIINIVLTNLFNLNLFFQSLEILIIAFTPFFGLRLLVWEKSQKLFSLILLSPIKKHYFVLSRFLALSFYFLVINLFIALPFFFLSLTHSIYLPSFFLGLLMTTCLFGFIIALGSFLSVFITSPLVNSFLLLLIVFTFYIINLTNLLAPIQWSWTIFIQEINPFFHLENFKNNVFDLQEAVYFLLVISGLLYWAGLFLEKKKIKN